MGYKDRWLIPGKGTGNTAYFKQVNGEWYYGPKKSSYYLPSKYTVSQVRKWVIDDFGGKIVRKIKSRKSKLKSGEYRIAMRISTVNGATEDFHFWKQNPKTEKWYHKPGTGQIYPLGKVNPDNSKKWDRYNSKTLYLAVKRKFT